ncbi:MAG: hypothetical protein ACRC0M_00435 [Legionella sp.]
MYDPNEANKTYLNLLKDKCVVSLLQSALLVIAIYIYNQVVNQQEASILNMALIYIFFFFYFSFKPKVIRFLRGHLGGEEFRNKSE